MTLSNGQLQAAAPFPSSTRLDLDPAFSPDGHKLAFVSERSGTREVWVSNADGSNPSQLTALGGPLAGRPSWSPDGQHLAFHGAGINVMPAQGGPARRLCDDGERPTWSTDGKWIYFIRSRGKFTLWKVPVAGGTPEEVIAGEVGSACEGPQGGDLYYSRVNGIWRRPLNGGKETPVIPEFPGLLTGYWAVVSDGIYYVLRKSAPGNTLVHHLKFYDFARGQVTDLGPLVGHIEEYVGGLTVSSDRRTVVYSQRTYESNEIMLVEHFR
jgi:dipeptidyl aminopeptidase/acylaminoacyl peptidase